MYALDLESRVFVYEGQFELEPAGISVRFTHGVVTTPVQNV